MHDQHGLRNIGELGCVFGFPAGAEQPNLETLEGPSIGCPLPRQDVAASKATGAAAPIVEHLADRYASLKRACHQFLFAYDNGVFCGDHIAEIRALLNYGPDRNRN